MADRRVVIPTAEVFSRHKETFDAFPAMGINPFLVLYFVVDQAFSNKEIPVHVLMADEHEIPQAVLDYLTETLGMDISGIRGEQYFPFASAINDFYRAILSVRDAAMVGISDAALKHGERIEWLSDGLVINLQEKVKEATYSHQHR